MGGAAEPGSNEARLRRELGPWLATAVTINAMVGTGIFRLAPKVQRLAGGGSAALLAWLVGGLISLCGALCMAELAAAMPRAGGIYEYLRRSYGKGVAFWYGWTRLTLLGPSAAGSFARLAAESFAATLGLPPAPLRDTAVAALVLVVCTVVNLAQVRAASSEQAVLSALKFAGLTLLGAACFVGDTAHLPQVTPAASASFSGLFAALVSVMWSYDGCADVSSLAAEARDPGRTLPRALLGGTLAVTLVYVLVNVGYQHVLGDAGVEAASQGSDMVAVRAAEVALGPVGRRLLSGLVFASCVGACMVGVLTGSRVFVSMASDGLFVPWLGHVSPHSGVPARAVVLTSGLGVLYLSVRSFEQLTDSFVAGMFPFYLLAVVALVRLRRAEPTLARPFRTPLYPLVPALFVAGAVGLLWGSLEDVEGVAYFAFALMFAGLPLGLWLARRVSAGSAAHP